jgi:hypothetical protein
MISSGRKFETYYWNIICLYVHWEDVREIESLKFKLEIGILPVDIKVLTFH